ncbi:MAG TPA: SDR family NAD(P)-dependent oxidoreductase [Acidimicrobiales bacterium]
MDELRFDGRSVIVTGGGRGFGRQHAKLLGARGARVVVADYGVELDGSGSSPEPAESVVAEITDAGGEAVACFADVSDEAGAAKIVQTALDAFGGVDVLVNNAGISNVEWIDDVPDGQFRKMIETHYFGTVNTSRAAWPHLKQARNGCIVNTASESIIGNIPKNVDYGSAKGAVFAFTKNLALNGRLFGIRVNGISPRGMTRMCSPEVLAKTFDAPEDSFQGEFYDAMLPQYASAAVGFLAHESCPLNGEVIVCGGRIAKRMAIIQTKGITVTGDETPEDLMANMDQLMDPTDADVMTLDLF